MEKESVNAFIEATQKKAGVWNILLMEALMTSAGCGRGGSEADG